MNGLTLECAGLKHRDLIIGQHDEKLRCQWVIEDAWRNRGDLIGIKIDENRSRIRE